MKKLLQRYEQKKPEIVFHWNDPETEAEGWVVINSLRGGAAGGGTRMRKGLNKNEVLSLAKTMEVKFTVSGPAIGGAKSGINFDPADPRKEAVLKRWFQAVSPLLKSYYGTGGDLHVDEINEVIPITESCGVWHPQEGVFNGHFKPTEADKINRIGQLRQGVIKVLENPNFSPDVAQKFTVADMITGYGVAESIKHFYALTSTTVEGKKAIVQHGPPNPADMFTNWADVSKARRMLGWSPEYDMRRGTQKLVEWYLAERSWAKDVLTP